MKNFITEFKQFAIRGNVIDLAVAVVIGTAFGKITSSLVDNIIMPMLGILLGGINLNTYTLSVGESTISYGTFAQAIIEFTLIALAVFVLVKVINKVKQALAFAQEQKAAEPQLPSEEVLLLRDIKELLQQSNKRP
jgi:large conductance mechanosensitive channel